MNLELALIRWSVVCRTWHELSANSAPDLGAFLCGWTWCQMGNALPPREQIGTLVDSFRVGFREASNHIEIANRSKNAEHHRAVFEAFISEDPFGRSVARFPNDESKSAWPGNYTDIAVQLAWEAYCEGRKS